MKAKAIFFSLLTALTASSAASAQNYLIQARTCSQEDAGNDDSYIYISIYGQLDQVSKFHLNSPRNDFRWGATDSFQLSAAPLGKIKSIDVEIVGKDGWCFDWIKITDVRTRETWAFFYHAFIDGNSEWPSIVHCSLYDRYHGTCRA
jgi:hypothetical protein